MRLSVERLRWGLLAGSLLLVGVLVVLVSYGRYRAVQAWKQIVKRSGATITHEADGITWSQALGKKQIFTLHAKHVVPHGDGKYTLQDGMLELYGPDGKVADRISGAQFEYDETQGVAHAAGVVDMEIELPKGIAHQGPGPRVQGPEGQKQGVVPQVIHVRTSGLTYVKKLGVAATDQEVEIEYAGMHGWAKGAEFDTGQSVVHLLADVKAQGMLRGAGRNDAGTPATLTAAKADLDRDADRIDLTQPRVESGGRTGSAAAAVLHLRKDGSLEVVEASGGVTLKQDTRTITAGTLHAAMNERSQMQRADLAGLVTLVDRNAERPMQGSAQNAKIAFDNAGIATNVFMDSAHLVAFDRNEGTRQMGGDHMTLMLGRTPNRSTRVTAVHAQGDAWANSAVLVETGTEVISPNTTKVSHAMKTMEVRGDDLVMTLTQDSSGKDEPQTLSGVGHTQIKQGRPDGTVRTSLGDRLEAQFAEQEGRGLEIASAEQAGHVQIRSVPGKQGVERSEGVAERAELDGASDVLTLSGRPRLTRGDTTVTADTVKMMQQTGDAVASGNVAGTFVNANAQAGAAVTHVLAQQATLRRAAQTVEFTGTDAAPARLWQGPSQVEAANLLLDRGKDAMHAWPQAGNGVVRSVFAESKGPPPQRASSPGTPESGPRVQGPGSKAQELKGDKVARVTSGRLDYFGVSHQAIFREDVLVEVEDGQARAQYGVAFLTPKQGAAGVKTPSAKGQPDPVASSLERVVMSHGVKVEQPGRVGTGDELLYTAATGDFVLTGTPGHPPRVIDDKQGSITGPTLLFHSPDSTIVVGGLGSAMPGSQRVHTETTIKK